MKYLLLFASLLSLELFAADAPKNDACAPQNCTTTQQNTAKTTAKDSASMQTIETSVDESQNEHIVLKPNRAVIISVVGQGVAPTNTTSPAQAYALAKRAAIADGYRLIAEKLRGVEVEGQDLIKNMMVERSTVRTAVYALVKQANVVETNFRDGLCEVEMEIRLSYDSLPH